jgi:hypothetical protein
MVLPSGEVTDCFLQVLRVMNLLSENVHVSGLTALWPKITRIPNLPQHPRQGFRTRQLPLFEGFAQ